MLKVTCIRQLGKDSVVVDNNGVVIIEDNFGNPIVVVVQIQPGVYTVVNSSDEDFNRVLQGLGIDKIVVNEKLQMDMPLPSGDVKLIRGPTGFNL